MNKALLFLSILSLQSVNALKYNAAQVTMKNLKGEKVGNIYFSENNKKIKITGKIKGLKASSKHGMHIHQHGTCIADFGPAGSHYDPTNANKHGDIDSKSHYGDLGNIKANKNGIAKFTINSEKLFIDIDRYSIVGRSIIIHADKDDKKTSPSGNSGKRIACGVIEGIK